MNDGESSGEVVQEMLTKCDGTIRGVFHGISPTEDKHWPW